MKYPDKVYRTNSGRTLSLIMQGAFAIPALSMVGYAHIPQTPDKPISYNHPPSTQGMLAAADRGVKIRLLLDDMPKDWSDEATAIVARGSNIELRRFNPVLRPAPSLFDQGWKLSGC